MIKILVHKAARRRSGRVKRGPPLNLTAKNKAAFAQQAEEAIRISFLGGIERFKKRIPKAKIDEAFNARGYEGLRTVVPWDDLPKDMKGMADRVTRHMKETKNRVDAISSDEVDARYRQDQQNPAMAKLTQDRIDTVMRDLTEEGAAHLHRIIEEGNAKGLSPQDLADKIKQGIGLNKRQNIALANYENGLIEGGKFSKAQIAKLKKARYEEMLSYRAQMIAVTETSVAANGVETLTWQAQAEDGIIDASAKRVWVTEPDCCDVCTHLSGKKVGLYEEWVLPDGRSFSTPGTVHPHCRCTSYLETQDD